MRYRVITVSRTLGAGGEEAARMAANDLAFRYVDNEIVIRAAEKAGVVPEMVAKAERSQPLLERILNAMGRSAVVSVEGAVYVPPPMNSALDVEQYEAVIEQVVREVASEGNAVIVAHGASIPLAGTEGLLRVLVTASPAVRARRLASEAGLDEKKAAKAIDDSDRQRRDYLRRFFDLSEELPVHYDLVVNTDVLSLRQAANLIAVAARE